jgi:hypothetical protein
MSARRSRELNRENPPGNQAGGGEAEKPDGQRADGDPHYLIRTMPAKGDRPAGRSFSGGIA